MKIGDNIKEVRNLKGLSEEYMADFIGIKTDKYLELERNEFDAPYSILQKIAKALSCSLTYLIEYKESNGGIYNHFDNKNGFTGTNIHVQGIDQEEIRKAYRDLYIDELKRIPKLEKLLKDNKIDFNF